MRHPKKIQLYRRDTASFDVDAQNCFTPLCPAELPVPGGDTIVEELNKQAQFARLRIGSKDAHPKTALWVADATHPPYSPLSGNHMDMRWPVHAVPGTRGFELIHGLPHPSEYDFFIWKGVEPDMHPYGACFHDLKNRQSTGVIEFLRQRDIRWVIVGGLATDYCVKSTALQLRDVQFEVILNLAACRGISETGVEQARHDMQNAGILIVDSCADLQLVEAPEAGP